MPLECLLELQRKHGVGGGEPTYYILKCNLQNKLNIIVPKADLSQLEFNPVCIIQSDFSSDDWQFYLTYFDSVFRLIEEAWTPPAEGEQ